MERLKELVRRVESHGWEFSGYDIFCGIERESHKVPFWIHPEKKGIIFASCWENKLLFDRLYTR